MYKKEKTQKKALEIANTQLQVFAGQIQDKMTQLEVAYMKTLNALSMAAEYRDENTGQHIRRLSKFSEILGKSYGLDDEMVANIALGAPMHDIGKIGIADSILLKPGKLTAEEFKIMQTHTLIGGKILGDFDAPIITLACEIALCHHEKWNGKGYPHGLSGEEIPISGRIVCLVDCFDALTSRRPYKEPFPLKDAYDFIISERGGMFDPKIVEAFEKCFDELCLIKSYFDQEVPPSEKPLF